MTAPLQLTKASLAWLLLSVFAVVVPHLRHLPPWIMLTVVAVIVWRTQIYRRQWAVPRRWAKLFLVVGCIAGLTFNYPSFLGLEPMVALLIISLTLKLLEMYRHKDATAVVLLCFFTTSAQFLFGQTVLDFMYGLMCYVLLICSILSLNVTPSPVQSNRVLPQAIKLTLQCLPVVVALFVLFPKIGSLWSVPLPQNAARTGVSDTISPGDISRLTKDGGKAFTVSFEKSMPDNKDLYWRGIVLSDFDGKTWSSNRWASGQNTSVVKWNHHSIRSRALHWFDEIQRDSEPIRYEIILEPTQQTWLFALPLARVEMANSGLTREYTAVSQAPVRKRINYQVESVLNYKIDQQELPQWHRQRNLNLPEGFNQQTLSVARQWQADSQSTEQLIGRFLDLITRDYTYTLEPDVLGLHTVDDFLWKTKKGYCEHFASAFVVFMRAAGVPARLVAGYQGGEVIGDFLQVSQADAHAWAEVWIEGQGWQRVDPTAAIAPDRVENGIRSVFDRSVSNPLSFESYRHIYLINNIRLRLDTLNYKWQKFVLNYDNDSQNKLLTYLLGTTDKVKVGLMLGLCIGFILIGLIMIKHAMGGQNRRAHSIEYKAIKPFLIRAEKAGYTILPSETLSAFVSKISKDYPQQRSTLAQFVTVFENCAYQGRSDQLNLLRHLANTIKL